MLQRSVNYALTLTTFADAYEFAKMVAATEMVPDGDRNKPGNVLAKMQIGAEIGLPPMTAIQTLYVTKGKVSMELKAMLALVEASGKLEDKSVDYEADGTCVVMVKRVGRRPVTQRFGPAEAKTAGLAGKDTYTKWGYRMFYSRAMGFALQDEFQDVLRGVVSFEYMQDAGMPAPVAEATPSDMRRQVDEEFARLRLSPAKRLVLVNQFKKEHGDDFEEPLFSYLSELPTPEQPAAKVVPKELPPAVEPERFDVPADREPVPVEKAEQAPLLTADEVFSR